MIPTVIEKRKLFETHLQIIDHIYEFMYCCENIESQKLAQMDTISDHIHLLTLILVSLFYVSITPNDDLTW